MASLPRALIYGFLTWLVPFVLSFGFVDRQGQYLVDVRLFKAVMFVSLAIVAAALLVLYFRKVKHSHFREGVALGALWLAMNLALDFIVLLPLTGMSVRDYLAHIGLGYLAIPAMAIMAGHIAAEQRTG